MSDKTPDAQDENKEVLAALDRCIDMVLVAYYDGDRKAESLSQLTRLIGGSIKKRKET